MKKIFSLFKSVVSSQKFPVVGWIIFHGGLLSVFIITLMIMGIPKVNTDLFDILPVSSSLKSVADAEKQLSAKTSRSIFMLAGHEDFNLAKTSAEKLYASFSESSAFDTISFYVDEEVINQFTDYLREYRYVLLDNETKDLLEQGEAQRVADDALASAFGAFNLTSLDAIDRDPFLLADREMKYFLASTLLSSGSMSPRDDVLAAQHDGLWYVMIRGTLSAEGVSITNDDSAVEKIYSICDELSAETNGLQFVFSGVPFHSYESSSNAQREISLITIISMIICIIIFVAIFRSLLPVIVSVLNVSISLLFAVVSVLLLFREIHILTFVFGTTLIGIGLDYSIHYFINWKANRLLKTGIAVRSHVFRSITMSFVSSEICFAALLFAPFVILNQFAVFLMIGLLSSYMTVMCLLPSLISMPSLEKRVLTKLSGVEKLFAGFMRLPRKAVLIGMIILSLAVIGINRQKIRIENNLSALYSMSGTLIESEKTAAQVLNHGSTGWYFIVTGNTTEEVLRHEEQLRVRLDNEIAQGNMSSYMASSLFIPSRQTQMENYAAAEKLLPLAESQFAALGFSSDAVNLFLQDFSSASNNFISPEKKIPEYLQEITSHLWIGSIGEKYYSCVLPLHTSVEEPFREIASELDFVFFVNKVKDIGTELNVLTKTIFWLLLAAFAVIVIVIRFLYPWKETLKIAVIPLIAMLVILSVLSCNNIPLGFFPAVSILLILGLGLDYMFYVVESETSRTPIITILAIVLSFATTLISFGALSLSNFIPVHMFGLTVFIGLTTTFVTSMLISKRKRSIL
jgi:predicted exporter